MNTILNLSQVGIAVQGNNPVSYFADQPTQGNPEITSTYAGALLSLP